MIILLELLVVLLIFGLGSPRISCGSRGDRLLRLDHWARSRARKSGDTLFTGGNPGSVTQSNWVRRKVSRPRLAREMVSKRKRFERFTTGMEKCSGFGGCRAPSRLEEGITMGIGTEQPPSEETPPPVPTTRPKETTWSRWYARREATFRGEN